MDNVIVGGVGRFIDGAVKQHHCGGVLPGFVLSTKTWQVIFQEENYLVQGGCPSKDPEVQKYARA